MGAERAGRAPRHDANDILGIGAVGQDPRSPAEVEHGRQSTKTFGRVSAACPVASAIRSGGEMLITVPTAPLKIAPAPPPIMRTSGSPYSVRTQARAMVSPRMCERRRPQAGSNPGELSSPDGGDFGRTWQIGDAPAERRRRGYLTGGAAGGGGRPAGPMKAKTWSVPGTSSRPSPTDGVGKWFANPPKRIETTS